MKNYIKRVKAQTPRKDRIHGQISTSVSGTLLTLAFTIEMPWKAQLALIIIGSLLGLKAGYHAQKTLK